MVTQQMMAQQQLEQMRRQALADGPQAAPGRRQSGPTAYLLAAGGRTAPLGNLDPLASAVPRRTGPSPAGRPTSWRDRPAAQQPEWPDPDRLDARPRRAATRPAARVRRRGPRPHRRRSARWPRAGPSCCRRATAPSRSTASRPTPSATSSRSSCRWRSCSPTPPACRREGRAASPASSPSPARRPPRCATASSCRRSAATSSTTSRSRPRPASPDPARLLDGLPPVGGDAEPAAGVHQGRLRRPLQGPRTGTWSSCASSPEGRRYEAVADGIDAALRFMAACGIDLETEPHLHEVDFYTSHEALLLGYEEALTRQRQPHRRLVRLLGPPAVDRRADPPARRRPRRVPVRRRTTPSA